jgi:hypothetical protein
MHLLVQIAGWLCLGVIGLIAFWYLVIGAVLVAEKMRQRRRRRQLAAHAGFGVQKGHESDILADGLRDRLESIGPFTMNVSQGCREITWETPNALPCELAPVDLTFVLEPDNVGPDEATFALWECYKARHAEHVRQFATRLAELHRDIQADLTDEQALAKVEHIHISVVQDGFGDHAAHTLRANFALEWDPEHGYRMVYDPTTGIFVDEDE